MSILIGILTVIEVIVCLFLILIVLMQRPRQEGLGAAFGGGVTDQMFGAQTTNVLQKFTGYLAGALFLLTLALAVLTSKMQKAKTSDDKLFDSKAAATAPATPATPAAAVPVPGATTPPAPGSTSDGKTISVTPQPGGTVVVKQPEAKPAEKPAPAAPAPSAQPAAPAPTIKLNSSPSPASQPVPGGAAPPSAAPPAPPAPKPATSAPAAATPPSNANLAPPVPPPPATENK